jgi:hypothetical protein
MGHSSIQVTVDIYRRLIPGANVSFVDRLDEALERQEKNNSHNKMQHDLQARPSCQLCFRFDGF